MSEPGNLLSTSNQKTTQLLSVKQFKHSSTGSTYSRLKLFPILVRYRGGTVHIVLSIAKFLPKANFTIFKSHPKYLFSQYHIVTVVVMSWLQMRSVHTDEASRCELHDLKKKEKERTFRTSSCNDNHHCDYLDKPSKVEKEDSLIKQGSYSMIDPTLKFLPKGCLIKD